MIGPEQRTQVADSPGLPGCNSPYEDDEKWQIAPPCGSHYSRDDCPTQTPDVHLESLAPVLMTVTVGSSGRDFVPQPGRRKTPWRRVAVGVTRMSGQRGRVGWGHAVCIASIVDVSARLGSGVCWRDVVGTEVGR